MFTSKEKNIDSYKSHKKNACGNPQAFFQFYNSQECLAFLLLSSHFYKGRLSCFLAGFSKRLVWMERKALITR